MATRDQMIADALKEVKDGLKDLGNKFDNNKDERNREMAEFKQQYAREMAKLETQVKIYAGIAGALGMAIGTAVSKLLVR